MVPEKENGTKPGATKAEESSKRNFYICVLIVGVLSLVLAPFFGHHYDPNVIAYAGVQVANGIDPYGLVWWYSYAYPPLYLYYSGFIGFILNDVPLDILPEYRIPPLHLLLIKLPSIVSHLGIAVTLYSSTQPRFPKRLPFLYLFSPFPFFISTIWGNIDELCAFFILLSVLSLYRGKWLTAGLMWGIASSLKIFVLFGVIIAPLLVIAYKQRASLKRYLSFILASFTVLFVTSFPFLIWNSYALISSLLWRIGFAGWAYDLGLSYGVVLSVLMQAGGAALAFLGLVPPLVFLVLLVYLIVRILKSKSKLSDYDDLNKLVLAVILVAFLSTIVVNEMNYVWALPFLLIYWSSRTKRAGRVFLILNIFLLVAVMVDWTPLDFIPGIDPMIVNNYQRYNYVRVLALAGLGVGISIIVFLELLTIYNELKLRTGKQGRQQSFFLNWVTSPSQAHQCRAKDPSVDL